MPHRTLDEYLKQTTPTTTKQHATKPKYRITGFHKETQLQETPIGKIPKEWKIVKLYEISDKIKAGGTPRVSKKEYWSGNIPFVKIEDLTASGKYLYSTKTFITELGLEKSNAWIVPEESLLLAMYGSMGEVAINKIKVATNQAILGIIPRRGVTHVEYLYYWFLYFKPKWRIYAKWTTQPNLTAEIVKNSYVPLPPLEEQWGIAEVLSSVDEAIEATEMLIGRLERLKRGLMQELLTKGIGHSEYKQTPIGKIPKEWQLVKVKELFNVVTGTTPSTKVRDYWDNGTINWITPQDLSKLNGKIIIRGSERKITEKALKDYHLTPMPRGSIILSTRAPVGYVAVLEEPATFNQGCKGLIPKKSSNIVPEFYAYYYMLIRPILEAKSGGSTFKELSKKALEETLIPYPPYEEQQKIASTIMFLDRWLEVEEKRKEKLERLKRGLMELLLTGRVRVRVERLDNEENLPGSDRGG